MTKTFEDLLSSMEAIAKTVNAFNSDAVQQQVFAALLKKLAIEVSPPDDNGVVDSKGKGDVKKPPRRKTKVVSKDGTGIPKKGKKGSSPKVVPDLNLRPQGKKSLKDFVADKQPKDNQERFAVIVYYLQKQLGVKGVGANHIYTAFKELNVKVPLDIEGALPMTTKRKGWLRTSDLSDVTLTVSGENFVEHDLPRSSTKK